jgi:hypothetical protein
MPSDHLSGHESNIADSQFQDKESIVRRYNAQEFGSALSTALEALGIAAQARDRDIQILMRPPGGREMVDAYDRASAATAIIDNGLAAIADAAPPDDYLQVAGAFVFAVKALFDQWPAELASYGFGVIGQDCDAALKASEAMRAMAEFFHWWSQFQDAVHAKERHRVDLFFPLGLTATARRVVDKVDWVRTVPD